MKSNKEIELELASEDPEWRNYIQENEKIIVRTKDEILRILNAFMQAGIDLDKENVMAKMVHRGLYMPEDSKTSIINNQQPAELIQP